MRVITPDNNKTREQMRRRNRNEWNEVSVQIY